MFARLSAGFGWTRKNEGDTPSPFVLSEVYRYAGMLAGKGPDGRPVARPIAEFDALSLDGVTWSSMAELRGLLPWENDNVPEHIVPVPSG